MTIDNTQSRLPQFLAVGPPRTGTTWLHRVLEPHAGLPAGIKETVFFSHRYALGLEWYAAHFRHCRPDQPLGEICTYFEYPHARERIARHLPGCRIICSFRDPVDRAYSYYKFMRRMAYTKVSFVEALDRHRQMTEANRYAFHLCDWQARFGPDRVLVCLYDDLLANPQAYLDRVCEFIGVPTIRLDTSPLASERAFAITHAPRSYKLAQNARHLSEHLLNRRAYRTLGWLERLGVLRFCYEGGASYGPLDPVVRAAAQVRFRPEVEALEQLIGRDLHAWKGPEPSAATTATPVAAKGPSAVELGRSALHLADSDPRVTSVLARMPRGGVAAEIGVYKGDFSQLILEATRPHKLHLIDPWHFEGDATYARAVYGNLETGGQARLDAIHADVERRFASADGTVAIHREFSVAASRQFPDNYFDWIYIDANHQYDFVLHDLEAYLPKVKPGGFIACDDYGVAGWWQDGVTQAVNEFLTRGACVTVAIENNQCVMRKK